MRTLQFAGVAIIFGILTAKTIRDIMKDMKEKSDYGYDRRGDDHLDDNVQRVGHLTLYARIEKQKVKICRICVIIQEANEQEKKRYS